MYFVKRVYLSAYVVFQKVSNITSTPNCVFLSEDRNNLVRLDFKT